MSHVQRWAVLLVTLAWPLAGLAETHAVLIGIDKYDNPDITSLRYTVNDVKAFHDLLVDPAYGGAGRDNVVLMVPEGERALRPTRAGILVQIKKAALRTQPDDTLILYFAGHGMETPEGRFLLGVDADPLLLSDTAVPVDRLPVILADVRAAKILVIVDACRNDPAAGRAQADNPLGESFERGLRPRVLAPGGATGPRQVATWLACGVGQRAWEFSEHEHGVFSYFLLEGLKGGAAADGAVGLTNLSDHVAKQVADWARRNGKQQDPKLDNPDRLELILTRPRPPRPGGVQEIPLASLQIDSEPDGATVLVDGEVKGKTPLKLTFEMPDGQAKKVTVRLQLEGYEPAAAGIDLVPGQTQPWQKTLTKQALPPATIERPVVTPEQQPHELPDQGRPASWQPGWEAGPDGLPVVSIPGGPVRLGTDRPEADVTERPQHSVSLSAYKIQAVEVTNEAYAGTLNRMLVSGAITFDDDGNVVTTANSTTSGWPAGLVLIFTSSPECAITYTGARGGPPEPAAFFTVEEADHDRPAVPVTWFGAALYAAWNGMRLPTEAEWERAAQARDADQPYPWGGAAIGPRYANVMTDDLPSAMDVGELRDGASAAGCLQMVGNVWEWTADRFITDYHRQADGTDPQIGFSAGEVVQMSLRGGGYQYPAELTTVWTRSAAYAGDYGEDYGFRCVLPSQPTTNIILPKVSSGGDGKSGIDGGKTRMDGGQAQPPGANDDGEVEPSPVATVFQHPLNGTRLAIPEGWAAEPQPTGAVLIGNEDDEAGVIYFYISPVYTSAEAVHAAAMIEVQALGITWNQPSSSGTLTLADPVGPVQVYRNAYIAQAHGEELMVMVDVVFRNGIFHALAYAAPTDLFEDYLGDYLTVLTASVYP